MTIESAIEHLEIAQEGILVRRKWATVKMIQEAIDILKTIEVTEITRIENMEFTAKELRIARDIVNADKFDCEDNELSARLLVNFVKEHYPNEFKEEMKIRKRKTM